MSGVWCGHDGCGVGMYTRVGYGRWVWCGWVQWCVYMRGVLSGHDGWVWCGCCGWVA